MAIARGCAELQILVDSVDIGECSTWNREGKSPVARKAGAMFHVEHRESVAHRIPPPPISKSNGIIDLP